MAAASTTICATTLTKDAATSRGTVAKVDTVKMKPQRADESNAKTHAPAVHQRTIVAAIRSAFQTTVLVAPVTLRVVAMISRAGGKSTV